MRSCLILASASLAVIASSGPAEAQQRWSDSGFVAADVTVHRGGGHARDHADHRDGNRFAGAWWGSWYDPNLNRSWDSDSYNDWWHDRPDRAYPRWVQHNDGCDEGRMWQGGGAWRCSW